MSLSAHCSTAEVNSVQAQAEGRTPIEASGQHWAGVTLKRDGSQGPLQAPVTVIS